MKLEHLPQVNARYWTSITLASVFGTNMGDLYAHQAHLGILNGLALLAALASVVFVVERFEDRRHEAYYWLVILIIRTGATNIADYTAYRLHVAPLALTASLIALLCAFGFLTGLRSRAAMGTAGMPGTGGAYWAAMLTAGVFGTVAGDIAEHAFGEGAAAIVLAAVLICVLGVFGRSAARTVALYWATIAVARTAGTALGDWIADDKGLGAGLPLATLLTGLLFCAVVLFWRSGSAGAERLSAREAPKRLDDVPDSIGHSWSKHTLEPARAGTLPTDGRPSIAHDHRGR